jgi:RNA polymerase sigma-70 factor (ECF subfamily)
LYDDHRDAVYGTAVGLAGSSLAPDITQEVFVRMRLHPERFDHTRGSMRSFLLVMTRSIAIDHLRSDGSRHRREQRTGHDPSARRTCIDPSEEAVKSDQATRVSGALANLTADVREAVVTAYWGQLTYREVAEVLGAPEGTVKSRIRSGLRQLRAELSDLWPSS